MWLLNSAECVLISQNYSFPCYQSDIVFSDHSVVYFVSLPLFVLALMNPADHFLNLLLLIF